MPEAPHYKVQLILFDPAYFIFDVGISLQRHIEEYEDGSVYVRKEFQIGLLLVALRVTRWTEMEFEDA